MPTAWPARALWAEHAFASGAFAIAGITVSVTLALTLAARLRQSILV